MRVTTLVWGGLVVFLGIFMLSALWLTWFFDPGTKPEGEVVRDQICTDVQRCTTARIEWVINVRKLKRDESQWWISGYLHWEDWSSFVGQLRNPSYSGPDPNWSFRVVDDEAEWEPLAKSATAPDWWQSKPENKWGPAVLILQSGKLRYVLYGDRSNTAYVFGVD